MIKLFFCRQALQICTGHLKIREGCRVRSLISVLGSSLCEAGDGALPKCLISFCQSPLCSIKGSLLLAYKLQIDLKHETCSCPSNRYSSQITPVHTHTCILARTCGVYPFHTHT